jgi:hypothetical protein
VVKDKFEFSSTINETRTLTKAMENSSAVRSYLENNNLAYFIFYPKSLKPTNAVIRHPPLNTPEEDISDGLVRLDFDVISVKQMTATRRSPSERTTNLNLLSSLRNAR